MTESDSEPEESEGEPDEEEIEQLDGSNDEKKDA